MTRQDHLTWAKRRALRYLDAEHDLSGAHASMESDLSKHPDLKYSDVIHRVGMLYLMNGDESTLRAWIEGFQ